MTRVLVTAVVLGAAGTPAASTAATASAGAQVVVDWNVVALRTSAAAPFDPPRETRNLAVVQAAVYDAVAAADGDARPYAVAVTRPRAGSPTAAAVAAAHDSLVALYPDQRADLDRAYQKDVADLPAGADTARGLAIGRGAAAAVVALRRADGSADTVAFTPGPAPGQWQPTPPAFRPALEPGWGRVTPFLIADPRGFRPGPAPALGSATYARDFAEIVTVGSAESATRTPEQSDTARFWVATAPQLWNQAAQQLVRRQRMSITRAARAFALLNLAGADAFITAWDAKFAYSQWRPVTAVRAADTDGNPATAPDPAWTPLLATPPFPDYPAAHAVYAGAAETVLTAVFGERPGPFRMTSPTAPGVVHRYTDFHTVAAEVVDARVWGGVHWRTSGTVGRRLGQRVARYGLREWRAA